MEVAKECTGEYPLEVGTARLWNVDEGENIDAEVEHRSA